MHVTVLLYRSMASLDVEQICLQLNLRRGRYENEFPLPRVFISSTLSMLSLRIRSYPPLLWSASRISGVCYDFLLSITLLVLPSTYSCYAFPISSLFNPYWLLLLHSFGILPHVCISLVFVLLDCMLPVEWRQSVLQVVFHTPYWVSLGFEL